MGVAATMRSEPARAVGRVLGPLLLLTSACGPTTSLDASEPTGEGSSTTAAAVASTQATVDGSGSSSSETTPPDDPPPDVPEPLPPGACPAACSVELPLAWSWDEELPPAATERQLVGIARAPDGGLVVAENRDGVPWLVKVHPSGRPATATALTVSCDCQLLDLALDASGELLLVGEGPLSGGAKMLVLTAVDPGLDPPMRTWIAWDIVYGTPERSGRVGSVIPLDDGTIAVLVVETGLTSDGVDEEWFEVFVYGPASSGSTLQSVWNVDSQLATGPPRRPAGTALPGTGLAMVLPGASRGAGAGDHVLWIEPGRGISSAIEPVPGVVDTMATGPDGAVVVAGSRSRSPAQVVLQAAGLPLTQPPAWSFEADVATTTASVPRLLVDALGSAYVAMPTTPGPADASGPTEVALWRLAADGTPVWSTTLPLAESGPPAPVVMTLAHDGQGLVLATLVDGRLHLERREQGCRCDA